MRSILLVIAMYFVLLLHAQTQTIGLFQNSPESYNGYSLFAPIPYTETYLIDNCGYLVHSWSSSYKPGHSVYLLEDGNLLRTGDVNNSIFQAGGGGGIIEMIDPSDIVVWSYTISDNNQCQHHDLEYLPNGNILAIVWDLKTSSEAIAAGRDPSTVNSDLWSEKIVEIDPAGNTIVWEWHVWDHLIQDYSASQANYGVVADHPELINLNYYLQTNEDWLHINSVDYNPELDQIMLSNHNFSEVWIIDHSTTTTEAAGHTGGNSGKGGDLLFRWGNPEAYGRGGASDQVFFIQHDARWIPDGYPGEGGIMVYNNGKNRPTGDYSTIDVIDPALNGNNLYDLHTDSTFLPTALSWQYMAPTPTDFYSPAISGAERQPNGNTLICEGENGYFFEVDSTGNILWEYINPVTSTGPMTQGTTPGGVPPSGNPNSVFRVKRYSPDYIGLQYYTLNPGNPIESNPTNYVCDIYTDIKCFADEMQEFTIYPNPANDIVSISTPFNMNILRLTDVSGMLIYDLRNIDTDNYQLDISGLTGGIYFINIDGISKRIAKIN